MKKEQRICVLLAIMILGIWGLEAKSSGSLIPEVLEDQNDPERSGECGAALYAGSYIYGKKTRGNPGDGGCCPHGIFPDSSWQLCD